MKFSDQFIMIVAKFWKSYLKVLDRFPLRTQIVQTGLIMGAGDAIAQIVIEKKNTYELDRTMRFVAIGSFFVAPTIRVWYISLEKLFGTSVTIKTTLLKVGTDQLFFAPIFTAAIMGMIGTSQAISTNIGDDKSKNRYSKLKEDIIEVKNRTQADLMDVVLTGWTIWPATQLANFYLVPFLVRPLVVSTVALFWNSYISWKTNRKIENTKEIMAN